MIWLKDRTISEKIMGLLLLISIPVLLLKLFWPEPGPVTPPPKYYFDQQKFDRLVNDARKVGNQIDFRRLTVGELMDYSDEIFYLKGTDREKGIKLLMKAVSSIPKKHLKNILEHIIFSHEKIKQDTEIEP